MFTKTIRKKHHEIVVERLRKLMVDKDLDALITCSTESFTYINTVPSVFLHESGVSSLAMIVIPRKGDVFGICNDFEKSTLQQEGLVENWYDYPMWIYIDNQFAEKGQETNEKERTEFYEVNSSALVLEDRLKAANLDKSKIGLEFMWLQVPVWESLQNTFPKATFIDAEDIYIKSRAVKTEYEIECLRHSATTQEDILFQTMPEVRIGMSHAEILSLLKSRSVAATGIDYIRFMFLSIGPHFAPSLNPYDAVVKPGDILKFDGGLVTRGYNSDAARTFIAGQPSPDQKRVNEALVKGQLVALDMMRPGSIPKDVFQKAMKIANENGLPDYHRGHVGHSIGLARTVEEPPFLSGVNEDPMVPGNVFCVEMPYYAHGFGSIMHEDMVVITEYGRELLTTRERTLHPIGD